MEGKAFDDACNAAFAAMEFQPFPKMARLNRDIIITEKIDGTNAQIFITESGDVTAGSRSRYIYPATDNYGFAKWVQDNKEELLKLGPGRHFGEWWGAGVQRRYNMDQKVFSLFNVNRWDSMDRPSCCRVVPVLYRGPFSQGAIICALEKLRDGGSIAAPGFMDPEGIVVFHTAAQFCFKVTIKNDDQPKSLVNI